MNWKDKEAKILAKLMRFCAYRERCTKEVEEKLVELEVLGEAQEKYLEFLRLDDFLNDARYLEFFVSGKWRIKGWGRKKIEAALRKKGFRSGQWDKAFYQIKEREYEGVLLKLMRKKVAEGRKRDQIFRFAKQRGFETSLIIKALKKLNL